MESLHGRNAILTQSKILFKLFGSVKNWSYSYIHWNHPHQLRLKDVQRVENWPLSESESESELESKLGSESELDGRGGKTSESERFHFEEKQSHFKHPWWMSFPHLYLAWEKYILPQSKTFVQTFWVWYELIIFIHPHTSYLSFFYTVKIFGE